MTTIFIIVIIMTIIFTIVIIITLFLQNSHNCYYYFNININNIRSPRLKCTAGKNTQLCVCALGAVI